MDRGREGEVRRERERGGKPKHSIRGGKLGLTGEWTGKWRCVEGGGVKPSEEQKWEQ